MQTIIDKLDSTTITALHDTATLLFTFGFEHILSNISKLNDAISKFNESIANRQDQFKHLLIEYNHTSYNNEYTVAYNQYIISSMFFPPNKAEIKAITDEVLPSFCRQNYAAYHLGRETNYSSILCYHENLGMFDAVLDVLLDLEDHELATTKDDYNQLKQDFKAQLIKLHAKYNASGVKAKRKTIHTMRLLLIEYFECINGLKISGHEYQDLNQALRIKLKNLDRIFSADDREDIANAEKQAKSAFEEYLAALKAHRT